MLQELRSASGRLVSVRQDHWRVLGVVRHDDCESWEIEGARPTNRGDRRTLLVPFDRPQPLPAGPGGGRAVGRRRGLLALRALVAGTAAAGQLRSAAAAAVEILDYQLEPALACLRGAARILIADEVGLGKTVEAGLVLGELASRGEADRVLVLTPASLCEQWAGELRSRFRLDPVVVDQAVLASLAAWSTAEEGPWARLPLAIASIDYVKQPEVLRGMGGVRWDLLVADEAHACAVAPFRAAALDWLARRARRLLLLTATPHAGDDQAFRALCEVGRFRGEPPVTMFRRTRAGLGGPPTRTVRLARVAIGPAEASLHRALLAYAARVWRREPRGDVPGPARLAMIVLCKRAASGPAALLASLARRLEWLGRSPTPAVQLALPLADERGCDDELPRAVLGVPGLADGDEERRLLTRLVEMARAASTDAAKSRVLLRLLSRARQPALVFTEYRDTLAELAPRLAHLGEVATLHGGLDPEARMAAVARFTAGGAIVLLATDAASLGLNLHASCRLIVNYDLPWSPMRLEQRIGRLDRIGQRRTVHAVHLVARRTFEEEVLGRLALRVEAIRRTIGLGASPLGTLDDAGVAAAVLGGETEAILGEAPLHARPGPPKAADAIGPFVVRADLTAEARAEARRLLAVRSLSLPRTTGSGVPPDLAAVLAACARSAPWRFALRSDRCGLAPGIYAIYRLRVVDARGALLHEEILPLFLAEAAAGGGSLRAAWPRTADAFDQVAGRRAAALLAGAAGSIRQAIEPQRLRESRLAEVESREPNPVQPGLFDHRALKDADRAAERRAGALAESLAKLKGLDLAARPSLSPAPEPLLVIRAARGRRPRRP